jgi:anti-sigma regulatory factor (Ser/Thr protein kinase)
MTSTLETTKSALWPQSPVPQVKGTAWQWQIATLRQLSSLRAELRTLWRSAGCDDATSDDPVSDRILLAVDELASNGLRHGADPVLARLVATAEGWLIDISDGATGQAPEPAIGRDAALGGLGLHLVAELTASRGWAVVAGRKHVWAFLPLDMNDRLPRPAGHGRGVDQPGAREPEDVADGDLELTSLTGLGAGAAPARGIVSDSALQPSTCPRGQERQSSDSDPFPIPSEPGLWAALTRTLFSQQRALANARRAVERDLRVAAQRQEAGRAFSGAAETTTAQASSISHHRRPADWRPTRRNGRSCP